MKVSYDFHIHSCLSPCADCEMTPNNIVNMSLLNGLDVIAITDHNSCKNCESLVETGKKSNLLVIPGMEICTSEEIHTVCLFPSVNDANEFGKYVYGHMPLIDHRPDIFGEEIIMNSSDEEIGKEKYYLLNVTNISVNDILDITKNFGGTSFPAHIDRDSYSIISVLGDIPLESGFKTIEISDRSKLDNFKKLYPSIENMNILTNSDSHYLESLVHEKNFIEIPALTPKNVIEFINGK